jgi:peroxiredoxin family protein
MFPFIIHSDTIAKWYPPIVIPNSGSTFGWRRVFHVIASLQNLYTGQRALVGRVRILTLVILSKSLVE